MSVDLRTRVDGDLPVLDPDHFFASELPEVLAETQDLIAPGAAHLGLRALVFEVDGRAWSLRRDDDGTVRVEPGGDDAAPGVRLSAEELTDLVRDQCTPMRFYVTAALDMPRGGLTDFLDGWLVLRGALDRRVVHVPGDVEFRDRDGAPLDLARSFGPDDDPAEMSHFLHEAGFLHLTDVFRKDEMDRIVQDMDRAAPSYHDGDGRSWWAGTADGARRLVRMQSFDEHSETAASLLEDPRFLRIGELSGDGHTHRGLPKNRIEALVKPRNVVQGISDVPWHKDCSLGRHSYECCSLTVGISATGADASCGQLRVVAGSHRALTRPAVVDPRLHGLPEIDLPTETGDVTVHLSCTIHMAQPPVDRERRVLYTGFRLPVVPSAAEARERAAKKLYAARESAPVKVSQPPGGRHY